MATEMEFGMTSQCSGTSRIHCPVAKIRMKKTIPLSSHSVSTPRCHQRASPMEWRRPGNPTPSGRVIESCFAVYSGSLGTGFCIRNQSLPGVECLVQ